MSVSQKKCWPPCLLVNDYVNNKGDVLSVLERFIAELSDIATNGRLAIFFGLKGVF